MNSHLMITFLYSKNKKVKKKQLEVEQHISKWYTYLMKMIYIYHALRFLDKNTISNALCVVALNLIFLKFKNRGST